MGGAKEICAIYNKANLANYIGNLLDSPLGGWIFSEQMFFFQQMSAEQKATAKVGPINLSFKSVLNQNTNSYEQYLLRDGHCDQDKCCQDKFQLNKCLANLWVEMALTDWLQIENLYSYHKSNIKHFMV